MSKKNIDERKTAKIGHKAATVEGKHISMKPNLKKAVSADSKKDHVNVEENVGPNISKSTTYATDTNIVVEKKFG